VGAPLTIGTTDGSRSVARTVLAGDFRASLEGLGLAINHKQGIEVVGVAYGYSAALGLIEKLEPEVVVVDFLMNGGLELLRNVTHQSSLRSVVVGVMENEEEILACARAGATTFVTREASVEDVARCIHATANGANEVICSRRTVGRLFQTLSDWSREQPQATIGQLTAREIRVLRMIERGMSNKEIGYNLHIQLATVKNHVHNILVKLGVSRRGQAADTLRRSWRIRPGSDGDVAATS